jgi:hypothetical protein
MRLLSLSPFIVEYFFRKYMENSLNDACTKNQAIMKKRILFFLDFN